MSWWSFLHVVFDRARETRLADSRLAAQEHDMAAPSAVTRCQ